LIELAGFSDEPAAGNFRAGIFLKPWKKVMDGLAWFSGPPEKYGQKMISGR